MASSSALPMWCCVLRLSEAHRTTKSLAPRSSCRSDGGTRRSSGSADRNRGLRLVAPDLHPERPRGHRQLAADRAVPYDPEPLAAQHVRIEGIAFQPSSLALALSQEGGSARAWNRGQGVLGHRRRVRARRVREQDAAFGHRAEREVLDAGRDAVHPAEAPGLHQPPEQRLLHPRHGHLERVRYAVEQGGVVVGNEFGAILGRRVELSAIPVEEEPWQCHRGNGLRGHVGPKA